MNQLEELLDNAITDPAPGRDAAGDWDAVMGSVATRQRRRAAGFRAGVVVLIAMLGFGLFSARFGTGSETIPTSVAADPTLLPLTDDLAWPTRQDVFSAAGERPQSQFWVAWLVGALVPLLAGVSVWRRAPEHLRVENWKQRFARLVVASSAGVSAAVAVGAVVGVLLFFTYDPLAAQSGTSWLLSIFDIVKLTFGAGIAVWTFSLQASTERRLDRARDVVSVAIWGSFFSALALALVRGFGLVGEFLDWQVTQGVDGPVRGLWRLVFQGEASFFGSFQIITSFAAVFALVVMAAGAGFAVWLTRYGAQKSLAGGRLQTRDEMRNESPSAQTLTTGFLLLAIALPLFITVQKDVHAQSVAHVVTLPLEAEFGERVEITRSFNRNPFEQTKLVDIELQATSSRAFAEIDEQSIRSDFRLFRTERFDSDAAFWSIEGEFWSIERDDGRARITVSATRRPRIGLDGNGVHTALYLGSLLLLLTTSTRIPRVLFKREATRTEITRSRFAGWFSIGASALIGLSMTMSLARLHNDVGSRASRGGEDLFDFYGIGARVAPESLRSLSPWFGYNVGILIPLFGLAIFGARRLGVSGKAMTYWVIAAVVSTIVMGFTSGQLLFEYLEWTFD